MSASDSILAAVTQLRALCADSDNQARIVSNAGVMRGLLSGLKQRSDAIAAIAADAILLLSGTEANRAALREVAKLDDLLRRLAADVRVSWQTRAHRQSFKCLTPQMD